MKSGLLARAALFSILVMLGAPASAQSWGNFWRAQATPAPCVLDECLNGGLKKTPAQQQEQTQPAEAAPAQQAGPPVATGVFDFYLLTLSWSPGFCDTGGDSKAPDQCSVGSGLGFVVHGLWPQYEQGYPQNCDDNSRPVSRAALALTHGVYPDEGLARYEWRKHGTCTGLSPEAFFSTVKRARDEIAIPDAFKAPREEQRVAPIEIARAFIAANPGLRLDAMAVSCVRGELEDVRICLSKDLRSFVNCPEVAHRGCRSSSISVAPIH